MRKRITHRQIAARAAARHIAALAHYASATAAYGNAHDTFDQALARYDTLQAARVELAATSAALYSVRHAR